MVGTTARHIRLGVRRERDRRGRADRQGKHETIRDKSVQTHMPTFVVGTSPQASAHPSMNSWVRGPPWSGPPLTFRIESDVASKQNRHAG